MNNDEVLLSIALPTEQALIVQAAINQLTFPQRNKDRNLQRPPVIQVTQGARKISKYMVRKFTCTPGGPGEGVLPNKIVLEIVAFRLKEEPRGGPNR